MKRRRHVLGAPEKDQSHGMALAKAIMHSAVTPVRPRHDENRPIRQAARTPQRTLDHVALLFRIVTRRPFASRPISSSEPPSKISAASTSAKTLLLRPPLSRSMALTRTLGHSCAAVFTRPGNRQTRHAMECGL